MSIKEFTNGDTVWLQATFRTNSKVLFDPTSTWGNIWDSSSNHIDISEFTKSVTGVYVYGWQTIPSSHANGDVIFDAYGYYEGKTYVHRGTLFRLV